MALAVATGGGELCLRRRGATGGSGVVGGTYQVRSDALMLNAATTWQGAHGLIGVADSVGLGWMETLATLLVTLA